MSLVTRTALAVATAGILMLVIVGGAAYLQVHRHTVSAGEVASRGEARLAAARLETKLEELDQRAKALSENVVIQNALLDSGGRTSYVVPFLNSVSTLDGRPLHISLLDFEGKTVAKIGPPFDLPPSEQAWLARIVSSETAQLRLLAEAGVVRRVLFAYPLRFPATGTVEGAMILGIAAGDFLPQTPGSAPAPRMRLLLAEPQGANRPNDEVYVRVSLPGVARQKSLVLAQPTDLSILGAAVQDLQRTYLLLGALMLLLAVGASIVAARRLMAPLRTMALAAQSIASAESVNVAGAVPEGQGGEIGTLSKAFNGMLLRLRHAAEVERESREARFRAVFEGINEGVVVIDRRGIIQSVNPAGMKMFGYGWEEMVGRNINMLMPEPHHSAHDGYLDRYLKTGEARIIGIGREVPGRRRDGQLLPMELSVSQVEIGGEVFFTGILRDISERVQAAQALRLVQEETRKLAMVAARTHNAVYITDDQDAIEWVNEGFIRLTGFTLEEAKGRRPRDLWGRPGDDPVTKQQVIDHLAAGRGFHVEIARHAKDGRRLWLELDVQPIRDESGRLANFVAICSDISERKMAEVELRQARDRAEVASRAKSEFLSTVSHELRTPLTSIRGALGLITGGAAGDLPPKAGSLLDIAHKNSQRLITLVNDILDIQRIESGKMEFRMAKTDLRGVIEQSLEANRAYAAQYQVKLEFRGGAGEAFVEGDSDRLVQVLGNLISNAAKFSPSGERVEVSLDRHGGAWRVSVADHGAGIPVEFRPRIFEQFAQADATDARRRGGSGLGLSISKAIVERHGGTIAFRTETGQGTVFYFDIPALDPAQAAGAPQGARLRRVLVCEDDPGMADVLRTVLEHDSMHVDVAPTLALARELLASTSYDALTLDLILPDGDGLALLRELRKSPTTLRIPVIVISVKATAGKREINGGAFGVLDWIDKPLEGSQIAARLRQALASHSGRARVLHVEDDADLARLTAEALQSIADVDNAPTLADARIKLASHPYDLLLLDLAMPDGDGVDLLAGLNAIQPVHSVIVFTARDYDSAIAARIDAMLAKSTTTLDVLAERVRRCLASRLPQAPSAESGGSNKGRA